MDQQQANGGQQYQHQADRKADSQSESQDGHSCPSCGSAVSATADLCESCGKWLMEGQCCFCYAPVRYGQKFCSSCGNSPSGILCSTCNTVSQFDCCPTCDKPLSKRSAGFIAELQQSPEMQELKKMAEAIAQQSLSNKNDQSQPQPVYRKYVSTFSGPVSVKDYEEEMKASEEKKKEASIDPTPAVDPAELLKKVEEMQSKVFTDNQTARLFYTSIKILVPQVVKTKKPIGWKCNYASVVHPEGPSACSDPSQGGHWIYEQDHYVVSVEL